MIKSIGFVLFTMISLVSVQEKSLVQDREGLFSPSGVVSMDSMLRDYQERMGIYILVVTDSADISKEGYSDLVFLEYGIQAKGKKEALVLSMSRRNSKVFVTVNRQLKKRLTEQQVNGILEAGIPSLREKKPEEAAIIICRKAIDILDRLMAQ